MKKALLTISLVAAIVVAIAGNTDKSENKNAPTGAAPSSVVNLVSISGKVIDFSSGEALAGVEVAIEGSTKKVHTDFDGNFKIDNIKPGAYNLIASFISYNKSFVEKLNVEKPNQELKIKLQSAN